MHIKNNKAYMHCYSGKSGCEAELVQDALGIYLSEKKTSERV